MTDEDDLDETIEESFPASDPPANTVETGIGGGDLSRRVRDNPAASRFELEVGDQVAFLAYERTDRALTIVHTEVPDAVRGQHLGDALVEFAVATAAAHHLRLVPVCPFAKAYLLKHPQPRR